MISCSVENLPALDFLNRLIDNKDKDLHYSIFTDPPYGETDSRLDPVLSDKEIKILSSKFYSLADEVFLFSGLTKFLIWKDSLSKAGYRYIRQGVWLKPNAFYNPSPYTSGGIEYFLFASKSREGLTCFPAYRCSTAGHLKWAEENHPFRKPVPLARQIIRDAFSLNTDGVIVDPFAGSGSFGVAALVEGRATMLNDLDSGLMDNILWRTENYDLWHSSIPKEDIKVVETNTETNQSDDEAKNRRKRKKFSWKEEEIQALCETMGAHTARVLAKNKDKGMTEDDFLLILQGRMAKKNKKGQVVDEGRAGLLKRRISADRIWTKCAWIQKLALANGKQLVFPRKTQREREQGVVLGFLGIDA